jgi:tetratricopeptide (TPR) repeat protein
LAAAAAAAAQEAAAPPAGPLPTRAESSFHEGERAFWQGDLVAAELAFFEALLEDPSAARAHYYLGRIYQARDDDERARDHFEAAAPRFAEAFFFLGAISYNQRRWEDSAAAYGRYLEYYPDDAAAWYNLGVTFDAAGRGADAVAAYEKSLAANPRQTQALFNLAVSYHRAGDYGRAAFYWRRVLELEPDYAEAYYGLALALAAQDDIMGAAAALNLGVGFAPLDCRFFYQLGRVYYALGDFELATATFIRASELGYDEGAVAEGLGLAYAGRRAYDRALPLLKRATEVRGAAAGEAYAAIGRIERERGRPGPALANFYEAAARLNDGADAYNEIGEIYMAEELPTYAAEAFERAVAGAPVNLTYNYNLAVAYDRSAPTRAAAQWRRYVTLAAGIAGEKKRLAEAAKRLQRLAGEAAGEERP